ncbi:Hypoxanthine phosphoribosyltransferase [Phycicoccus elongatus Lp2]|uniref:tRNA(Ile)-lysidine synthase n=1 Tax=Phycicoccus elongatus Lp2 TaxID=1193181 RepID=N0E1Y8_9MICO|nr:Hypoxanthine phosphoribosyltransferase [Phycicoccus elongatus Lp2]
MGTVHADTRAGERMGAMGGPRHRPTAAIRYAVRSALADRATDDLVLVALSGGADSMALAAALAAEAPVLGLRAGAVIVDHGLLTDSSELARTTAGRAAGLGLDPVEIVSVTVDPTGRGVEAAARDARYAALSGVAERLGASLVLLGHTRDDQAEQVLLGLARGSGARSLAGMPSVRGIFRRPLLGVTRGDTRSLCEAANLPWWDDPMNDDPAYLRVKARRALADLEGDLGPGIREALARTADQLREDADHLDALADAAYATTPPSREGANRRRRQPLTRDLLPLDRWVGRAAAGRAHPCLATAPHRGRCAGRPGERPAYRRLRSTPHRLARAGPDPRPRRPESVPIRGSDRPRTRLGWAAPPTRTVRSRAVDAADMGKDLEKVLITEEQIHAKLEELAGEIATEYAGKDLLLVGVLKGAVMVMADLMRALPISAPVDWMAVSSYGSGTKSSGVVRILKDLDVDITGKHVLIVEDIVDSGLTLSWIRANLASRSPASVEICTLLRKPDAAKVEVDVKWVGFDIPNEFVVGYGLDYAEQYRGLRQVGTLAPHVYS